MRLVYWRAPVVLDRPVAWSFKKARGFARKVAIVVWGKVYRQPFPDCMACLTFVWAAGDKKRSLSVLATAGLPVVLRPTLDVDRSGKDWGATFLWLVGSIVVMWSAVDGLPALSSKSKERLHAQAEVDLEAEMEKRL